MLFFGDLFSARLATVGINPSYQEYLDRNGRELTGTARRFESLTSLGASSRAALTDEQCERAIAAMRGYFGPGRPVYAWFRPLARVTDALGASYTRGDAVHLDLIQEPTQPTWSALAAQFPQEASALLGADVSFLRWQLATFPLRAVVCNGMTPLRQVCALLDEPVWVAEIAQGQIARVTWYAAHGAIGGRSLTVVGWNIPLSRPTGLTTPLKDALGRSLAQAIAPFGCASR